MATNRVLAAIDALARGELIVVTDDQDRENEGDLVMAADAVNAATIAFMAVHGRGLVCLAMTGERLDDLELGPMVPGAIAETNFTISIDLDVPGSTGISAGDRAETILRAVDPASRPSDFRRPGHVFPLRAVEGGVLARRGHTEASVDLATLAGRSPAGVICEILNDDGTMARGTDIDDFARRHGLVVVSVAELVDHVRTNAPDGIAVPPSLAPQPASVTQVVETTLPTRFGRWRALGFRSSDGLEYLALLRGSLPQAGPVMTRLHSECLTGDALGSERCDCGRQLEMAMASISEEGAGVVVYILGHEGRGIGLLPKLQAYALQDLGYDTVDANLALGYKADLRDYRGAAAVLSHLGIRQVRLLTNNPRKIDALTGEGIGVVERLPLVIEPSVDNVHYLDTKRTRLGHLVPVEKSTPSASAG